MVTGLIMDIFTIIGLVFVVFYRDWKLAIFGIFVVPLAVYPIYYFGRRLRSLAKESQVVMGDLTTILQETIQGVRIVKAFNMEDYESDRFANESHKRFRVAMRTVAIQAISSPFMESLGGLCGGRHHLVRRLSGHQRHGHPGFFCFLYDRPASLVRTHQAHHPAQRGHPVRYLGGERVFQILDEEPEIKDKEGAEVLPPVTRAIEFKGVRFAYDQEEVLKGLNLTVRAGEALAVVGVSGGGKTTLVNLIPRFYDVIEGAILIDGRDVRDVTIRSLRDQISIVSQQVILFNDTVSNNISYGSRDRSREEIEAAAKAAYAYDFIMAMPEGFDSIIGESGVKLSGGERQRLAMARALLKNAPILILDEATSSLDTESELAVQRALENLMRGRTTVVIAHRLSTVRNADRIIVIAAGRIVEEGSP